jgi:hypothetical protein
VKRSSFERRLRDELHAARPPRAGEAEQRAWHVVATAHSERPVLRRRRHGLSLAFALAAVGLLLALVLTPAGAKVGDWIGEMVSPAPEATRSALASLPAPGRLLVVAEGGPWIVGDDGARRRLGAFREAGWSPGGLFVVAAKGRRLTTLEPDGDERWTRVAPARVATPRWSPTAIGSPTEARATSTSRSATTATTGCSTAMSAQRRRPGGPGKPTTVRCSPTRAGPGCT